MIKNMYKTREGLEGIIGKELEALDAFTAKIIDEILDEKRLADKLEWITMFEHIFSSTDLDANNDMTNHKVFKAYKNRYDSLACTHNVWVSEILTEVEQMVNDKEISITEEEMLNFVELCLNEQVGKFIY